MSEVKPLSQRLKPQMRVQHYRGRIYRIQSFATHSETEETMVIYRADSNAEWDGRVWARPRHMFDDTLEHEGQKVPRFVEVRE